VPAVAPAAAVAAAIGWLVGWLAGWLAVCNQKQPKTTKSNQKATRKQPAGWLGVWQAGWLAACLAGCQTSRLDGWVTGCLNGWHSETYSSTYSTNIPLRYCTSTIPLVPHYYQLTDIPPNIPQILFSAIVPLLYSYHPTYTSPVIFHNRYHNIFNTILQNIFHTYL
jgi:hypothetical protein